MYWQVKINGHVWGMFPAQAVARQFVNQFRDRGHTVEVKVVFMEEMADSVI